MLLLFLFYVKSIGWLINQLGLTIYIFHAIKRKLFTFQIISLWLLFQILDRMEFVTILIYKILSSYDLLRISHKSIISIAIKSKYRSTIKSGVRYVNCMMQPLHFSFLTAIFFFFYAQFICSCITCYSNCATCSAMLLLVTKNLLQKTKNLWLLQTMHIFNIEVG